MTPEEIAAAIRTATSGLMPAQVGIYCDDCGNTVKHDYLVSETSTKADRFEVARKHLRDEGWQCDEHGDFCPDCIATDWVGENGGA